jgi:hypothetical protein
MSDADRAAAPAEPPKLFIVYDERAMSMNTDDAVVICTAKTQREAESDVDSMFPSGVIFSYDTKGDKLLNEQYEPHSRRGW